MSIHRVRVHHDSSETYFDAGLHRIRVDYAKKSRGSSLEGICSFVAGAVSDSQDCGG